MTEALLFNPTLFVIRIVPNVTDINLVLEVQVRHILHTTGERSNLFFEHQTLYRTVLILFNKKHVKQICIYGMKIKWPSSIAYYVGEESLCWNPIAQYVLPPTNQSSIINLEPNF